MKKKLGLGGLGGIDGILTLADSYYLKGWHWYILGVMGIFIMYLLLKMMGAV